MLHYIAIEYVRTSEWDSILWYEFFLVVLSMTIHFQDVSIMRCWVRYFRQKLLSEKFSCWFTSLSSTPMIYEFNIFVVGYVVSYVVESSDSAQLCMSSYGRRKFMWYLRKKNPLSVRQVLKNSMSNLQGHGEKEEPNNILCC